MVVGELAESTDVLVIGGGPGGYTTALRAAELGLSVVLVDRDGASGLGGACLHVGCIPSKALIELAAARAGVSRMEDAGLETKASTVDLGKFQRWKDELVQRLSRGVASRCEATGVRVVGGTARFVNPTRAVIGNGDEQSTFVDFRHAVVATGSRPASLDVLPIDGDRVLDSTGVLALDHLPGTVAVVGGGYIGIELGMALARLGSQVAIVEALDRILTGVPDRAAQTVVRSLRRLEVPLLLGARATGLTEDELVIDMDGGEHRVTAEVVLVAVGRVPNTTDLGLARAGVTVDDRGFIEVDDQDRASPTVHAIGDVTAGPALAHRAEAQGTAVAERLAGQVTIGPGAIPFVVYADPEIASVGLTREQAAADGTPVRVGRADLRASGRAATIGEADGFVEVVVDDRDDLVLGVHAVGPHASEIIGQGVLAVEMMAEVADLALPVLPHPTIAESLRHAAVDAWEQGGRR